MHLHENLKKYETKKCLRCRDGVSMRSLRLVVMFIGLFFSRKCDYIRFSNWGFRLTDFVVTLPRF